jgi:hypothetical protein
MRSAGRDILGFAEHAREDLHLPFPAVMAREMPMRNRRATLRTTEERLPTSASKAAVPAEL